MKDEKGSKIQKSRFTTSIDVEMNGFVALVLLFSTSTSLAALPEPENCTLKANLPCKLYRIKNTADCFPGTLKQHFPELYLETDLNPPEALTFNYSIFYKLYEPNNQTYPGISLFFTPPASGGITYVKGFEITQYVADNPGNVLCNIFDLSEANWSAANDKNVTFSLDIHPISPDRGYASELFTLPKPPPDYFQSKSITYQAPAFETPITAATWFTNFIIEVHPRSSLMIVWFDLADAAYGFTVYSLVLFDVQSNIPYETVKVSRSAYSFKDVTPGDYRIQLTPMDDDYPCKCKYENGGCTTCTTSRSSIVTIPNITMTTKPPVTSFKTSQQSSSLKTDQPTSEIKTEMSPSQSQMKDNGVSTAKILAAVFGVIAGLILIGVIVVLVYCHRCKPEMYSITKKDMNDNDNSAFDYPDFSSVVTVDVVKKGGSLDQHNNQNAKKIQFERRKKLFLLYEEDHQYHRQVVDKFAMYLSTHCQCDVEQAELHHDAPWVHQDLARADYVLIVNSEAAYKACMLANAQKSTGKHNSVSSVNSIRNKFMADERYGHIIMVYFSYTDEKFILPDICTGYKYKLMKHFNDFLLHVHKLHRTDNLSRYDLPFDGNHNLRPVGQQLLNAIELATKYESENPNWFMQLHGMTRGISNTSEESRLQSADSGCPDDFTPGQTPVTNGVNPWIGPNFPEELMRKMETKSIITVTQSDLNFDGLIPKSTIPKQRPSLILSPVSFNHQNIQEEPHVFTPPTDSPSECRYDFIPPDLNSNFDGTSYTQAKQLEGIVNQYRETLKDLEKSNELEGQREMDEDQGHYDKDNDLALLDAHSREIMFNSAMEAETISIGGESI